MDYFFYVILVCNLIAITALVVVGVICVVVNMIRDVMKHD